MLSLQLLHYRLRRTTPEVAVATAFLICIAALITLDQPSEVWSSPKHTWPRTSRIINHDVYWQLPSKGSALSGLLIAAHGCNHAGGDFFTPNKACPHCLGLPEERRILSIALKRGLAFIAISSLEASNTGTGCWAPHEELASVPEVINTLLNQESELKPLQKLPIYALGASSGGAFVLLLPKRMQLQGVIAQIMAVPREALAPTDTHTYPPTVFMHMPRDDRIAPHVQVNLETLASSGVPVAELQIAPRRVTAPFLYHHSGGIIPYQIAEEIVHVLTQGNFLDKDGFLVEDPRLRFASWSKVVESITHKADLSLKADHSQVTELLNLAWASHEIVSVGVDSALEFLIKKGDGRDLAAAVAAEVAADVEGGAIETKVYG